MGYKSLFDTNGDVSKAIIEDECVLENAFKDNWNKLGKGTKKNIVKGAAAIGLAGWLHHKYKKFQKDLEKYENDPAIKLTLEKAMMNEHDFKMLKKDMKSFALNCYRVLHEAFPHAHLSTNPQEIENEFNKLVFNGKENVEIQFINLKKEWKNIKDVLGIDKKYNIVKMDELNKAFNKIILSKLNWKNIMESESDDNNIMYYKKIQYYEGAVFSCSWDYDEVAMNIGLSKKRYYLSSDDFNKLMSEKPLEESYGLNVEIDDDIHGNYNNRIGLPSLEEMRSKLVHTAEKLHSAVPDFISTLPDEMKDCFSKCLLFTGSLNVVQDATKLSSALNIEFMRFCPGRYKYYNQIHTEEGIKDLLKGETPEYKAYKESVNSISEFFNALICDNKKDYVVIDTIGEDKDNTSVIKYCVRFNKDIDVSSLKPGVETTTPVQEGLMKEMGGVVKDMTHGIKDSIVPSKKKKEEPKEETPSRKLTNSEFNKIKSDMLAIGLKTIKILNKTFPGIKTASEQNVREAINGLKIGKNLSLTLVTFEYNWGAMKSPMGIKSDWEKVDNYDLLHGLKKTIFSKVQATSPITQDPDNSFEFYYDEIKGYDGAWFGSFGSEHHSLQIELNTVGNIWNEDLYITNDHIQKAVKESVESEEILEEGVLKKIWVTNQLSMLKML